jgi:hypothetical protein
MGSQAIEADDDAFFVPASVTATKGGQQSGGEPEFF